MPTVAEVAECLNRIAPLELAEPWDNVGLLLGDPSDSVTRIMTCLTLTRDSANEAVAERANLVVSHHPIFFRGAKCLRADSADSAAAWTLAKSGASLYSPHTALDNADGGINDTLAKRLSLGNVQALRNRTSSDVHKIVVFAPRADREAVLAAAFAAGAGRIGEYSGCSYSSPGRGTFFGNDAANPSVGERGRRETVREWRIELICPTARLSAVIAAMRAAHSYEEPAIDVYPLSAAASRPGVGRIGELGSAVTLDTFAAMARERMNAPHARVVGDAARRILRVAIACGAGDDFLGDAVRAGADVLVTGEARFHRSVEAIDRGVALVLLGHFASERPGVEELADRLGAGFAGVIVWPSRMERDPEWVSAGD